MQRSCIKAQPCVDLLYLFFIFVCFYSIDFSMVGIELFSTGNVFIPLNRLTSKPAIEKCEQTTFQIQSHLL
jgi:hypothetical protein